MVTLSLAEREGKIWMMAGLEMENEGIAREEREKILAEIMFLTKSFGDLQSKLGSNAQMYEDCIETYKREAAEKDTCICALEEELRETNMRIHLLESQIEEPAS